MTQKSKAVRTNPVSMADQMAKQNEPSALGKNALLDSMLAAPIPRAELHSALPLFLDRRLLSRILWIHELYRQILPLHGNIFEFGVRYGTNLSLFTSLRGIYEPFNHNRKLVGFDTFAGFPHVHETKDTSEAKTGDFAVTEGYETFLSSVLGIHESLAPLEQFKKFEIIKGDATRTVPRYLKDHPETIIALAYLDFDLYEPTKVCLESIIPYLTKGALIVFDELNYPGWPGESIALREVLGTGRFVVRHSPFRAGAGYLVYE